MMNLFFRCMGAESDLFLSHSNGEVSLQPHQLGGEEWFVDLTYTGNDAPSKDEQWVFIKCSGGEFGKVLGHHDGKIVLYDNSHQDHSKMQWRIRKC